MTLSEIAASREASAVGTAGALVTLFASAVATAPEQDISLTRFIQEAREGTFAEQVAAVRSAAARGDRERLAWLKRRLPAVTLSCTMVSRAKDAPVRARTHSGWLQCDFDAKDNPALVQSEARAFLADDPHVGAVFVGPSGVGIKAAVRIDPANHRQSVEAAAVYFLEKYALALDKQCRDIERLCFVSHDPDAWIRSSGEAAILSVLEAGSSHGQESQSDITHWTMADVRELLRYLPPRPDYETWLRIASGVFSVLPFEPAVTVLKEWSPEEKPGEYEIKHRNRLQHVTIRTVIHFAKAHGFDAAAAARRQRWMGRLIFPGGVSTAAPTPHHHDLLSTDDEPADALKATDVWIRFEDEQLGDAQLFIAREGRDLAYDYLGRCWRRWAHASGLWERDIITSTQLVMSATVTDAYEGLIETIEGEIRERPGRGKTDARKGEIEKLTARCRELRRAKHMGQVMTLAEKIPGANRPATAYDRARHLLAVANGVIDFDAQLFRPATREDLLSVASPVAFDPAATCPAFDAFLARAFDHDADLIDYWWRIVGYSLTGYVDHDALFFCYGEGANGKSTAFMVLRMLLGDVLSTVIDVNTLLGTGQSDATLDYKKSMLEGKRLVLTDELPRTRKVNESMVKGLLGGEDIVARRPYERPYTFSPTHKIWMVGNHKPTIIGTDLGIWRRIHLIPWLVTIPAGERKPRHQLLAIFRRELPGILNAALAGYRDIVDRGGIEPPKAVLSATEEYRQEEDSLARFLDDQLCDMPGGKPIPTKQLFVKYIASCKSSGETPRVTTAYKLTALIQTPAYNLKVVRGAHNAMVILDRAWTEGGELILSTDGA